MKDKNKRQIIFHRYTRFENISSKKTFQFTFCTYAIVSLYYLNKTNEEYSIRLSLSRLSSRIFGYITKIPIPVQLREPIYNKFSQIYNVNQEDIVKNLRDFKSFGEFFTREIKPRYIDYNNQDQIVSPCDCKLLSFSKVIGDECLILKGKNYKLGELLTGIDNYKIKSEILDSMKKKQSEKKKTDIYQFIFYLNPGDYHRYHSPADFLIKKRNHIIGKLYPVKESYILKNEKVYENNERVSIFGEWKHGFLSMVFVGALNVGSIQLNFDKEVETNRPLKIQFQKANHHSYNQEQNDLVIYKDSLRIKDYFSKDIEEFDQNEIIQEENLEISQNQFKQIESKYIQTKEGIQVKKGIELGRFNMGSTIVLLAELPENEFEISVKSGDQLKYGQPICQKKREKMDN